MAKNDNLGDFLTDIANAIRAKKGSTSPISAQNFSNEIATISSANVNLQDKTVSPRATPQTIMADSGYDALRSVSVEPIILQNLGVNLEFTSDTQTIYTDMGKYADTIRIYKPVKLVPENIRSGIEIAGVVGTLDTTVGGEYQLTYNLLKTHTFAFDGEVDYFTEYITNFTFATNKTYLVNIEVLNLGQIESKFLKLDNAVFQIAYDTGLSGNGELSSGTLTLAQEESGSVAFLGKWSDTPYTSYTFVIKIYEVGVSPVTTA